MQEKEPSLALRRGLKNRHLQMIALGGAIGTGLFYGSASTIALAGPAVMLAYLLGGVMIFFIMRMLGEMAVDEPVSGSFSHYAGKYWGDFPGFLSGWNYWFNYIIVSMAELAAVGIYMNFWLPDLPQWISALICLAVITALNLTNVRAYGEMEFWMALVKITAIVLMIGLGGWLLVTGAPFPENVSNLWEHGGFLPNGWWGFFLGTAVVMFSFGGIELIGITAGEAEDPDRTIPKAINQVIWRILIFYVGTMAVLMALWPWNEVGMEASPFVQIFRNVGIPARCTYSELRRAHGCDFGLQLCDLQQQPHALRTFAARRCAAGAQKSLAARRACARDSDLLGHYADRRLPELLLPRRCLPLSDLDCDLCGRYQLDDHRRDAPEVP